MKQKTGRKLLSFLLALALVVGLVPGMGLRAYAAGGTEVTKANVICQQYSYMDAGYYGDSGYRTPPVEITNITLADAQAFGAAVTCPTTYWVVVYAKDGDNLKWTSNGKTGEQTSTPDRISTWSRLYNGDVFSLRVDPMRNVTFYFSKGLATVGVTGVSLDKTTAQTIDVDGKVSFTATVSPDNATDKTVKWSVGGTDAGAVKLYSNEACTTEVGADATDKLTVYAKGISAGSATVTATSNADSTKSASCDVTVNAAQTQTETLLTTITPTGKTTHSATVDGVVTVSHNNDGYNGRYGWLWSRTADTLTVSGCEGYTITKVIFKQNAKSPVTDSSAPFELHFRRFECQENRDMDGVTSIEVYGYANPTTVAVTGVNLNKTETTLTVNGNETLTATVAPDNATDKTGTVSWTGNAIGLYADAGCTQALTNGGTYTAGTFYVKGLAAGSSTITVTTTDGSKTATCDVTVNKLNSTVTKAPTAKTLTYTGSAQELVTAGTAEGGTMMYAARIGDTYPSADEYSENIPTLTNANDHRYVWYYVKGDANHLDSEAQCVFVEIAKASITPSVSIENWTYGEAAKTPSVTGNTGNGAVTYTYAKKDTTDFSATVPTDAGDYTAKAVVAETNNYLGGEATADFTIAKAEPTVTAPTAKTLTYTGSAQALVTAGEVTGGEMQYALGTATEAESLYTTSIPTATNAGTYYVWYRFKGDSNHNDVAAASVTVTINKKLLTITAGAKSKVYGEKDPELTYDSTGLVEGDNITGSLTRDAGENAGTYAITQGTVTASDNYELSYVPALLTITKADSNTTAPTANELNYSGSAQELVTAGTPTGGTLVYSTDGESYNEMIPTGINAGEYTVYYKVIGDANHNDKVVQQVTVTILARTLDIKADEKSKTYGEDDPALTYTSEGLVEGDSITGALSRAEGENVGTYAIEQGTLTAGDNYIITYTGANLAITEAASSVTTEPVTKMPTYNGGKQTLVAGGEVAGGTMQYALGTDAEIAPTEGWSTSIPAETDAGTYYVWYRAVGDNNHSDVEATCVSVDIEKAAITITADDKSSQKGAELQELSWQVSGDYVSGDELGISASTTADSSADAGVYPITVSWNDNANYEATLISGKYTITAPEESGRVETKTIVADNVPSCSISNLTTELARSLATEEELIRVQNGENLLIYLDMENIDDSVSATDKSLVEAAVKASSKDAKVGMYLDLTLYKKVGDGAATKVTDTKESRISVTIEVPDSLKGGSDVTRTFYIIRVHDGATDILATTTETTITFETDKFSTYALAYSDKSNGSPSVTTPAQQEKAPKTGDNFPSVWLWALILAGGLVPVGYAGGRHKGLERK